MVVTLPRLVPIYRSLPLMPSTWAFTFGWAAVFTTAMVWLPATEVGGYVF